MYVLICYDTDKTGHYSAFIFNSIIAAYNAKNRMEELGHTVEFYTRTQLLL